MSFRTSILTVSLFSCLQRHTQAESVFQLTSQTLVVLWTEGRPPRLHVEPRSLNEGCIESAPLFYTVSPTKGSVFHSGHTRAWDNTLRDLKATHTRGRITPWTKKKPSTPHSSCRLLNTLAVTLMASAGRIHSLWNKHIHMQTHMYAHSIPLVHTHRHTCKHTRTAWFVCSLTVGIMTSLCTPPTSLLNPSSYSAFKWVQRMLGDFSLTLSFFFPLVFFHKHNQKHTCVLESWSIK